MAALGVYGAAGVARWLDPAMDRVVDVHAMRLVLQQWIAEDGRLVSPAGRWAIVLRPEQTGDWWGCAAAAASR